MLHPIQKICHNLKNFLKTNPRLKEVRDTREAAQEVIVVTKAKRKASSSC